MAEYGYAVLITTQVHGAVLDGKRPPHVRLGQSDVDGLKQS